MFLRVPILKPDKNFDYTFSRARAVGRGQNVVRTFSPKLLDEMTSNLFFLKYFLGSLDLHLGKLLTINGQ